MVRTKGNVIVDEIKIGDIHYEFEYNVGIKSKVISLPIRDEEGIWSWQSENDNSKKVINYSVSEECPSYYSVNLYDYEAYKVNTYI